MKGYKYYQIYYSARAADSPGPVMQHQLTIQIPFSVNPEVFKVSPDVAILTHPHFKPSYCPDCGRRFDHISTLTYCTPPLSETNHLYCFCPYCDKKINFGTNDALVAKRIRPEPISVINNTTAASSPSTLQERLIQTIRGLELTIEALDGQQLSHIESIMRDTHKLLLDLDHIIS